MRQYRSRIGMRWIAWFVAAGAAWVAALGAAQPARLSRPDLKCLSAPAYYPGAGMGYTRRIADDVAWLNPAMLRIEFIGDGFLYKMVRNITGTLIETARGRFPETFVRECLESGGPFKGHCAPPHGLTLIEVFYHPESS